MPCLRRTSVPEPVSASWIEALTSVSEGENRLPRGVLGVEVSNRVRPDERHRQQGPTFGDREMVHPGRGGGRIAGGQLLGGPTRRAIEVLSSMLASFFERAPTDTRGCSHAARCPFQSTSPETAWPAARRSRGTGRASHGRHRGTSGAWRWAGARPRSMSF